MINYTGTFKVIREVVDWINNYVPGGGSVFFKQEEYTNINGDTVNVLCQLPEATGSDPYFATAEYTNINGDTVTVLYQV